MRRLVLAMPLGECLTTGCSRTPDVAESTTMAYASGDSGLDVDEVALLGSPGAGSAAHAGGLSVGQDHVYVGRDSRDFVATLGDEGMFGKGRAGLGTDPSSEDFEATRFQGEDVNRGDSTNFGDAHGSYFNNDTDSLYNIGKIVNGHDREPAMRGP